MKDNFKVFISHHSVDAWVAEQIAEKVSACGAKTFLSCIDIQHGDDFEERMLEAAETFDELLVLLTARAIQRPYILLEIGAFWVRRKRIVVILYGVSPQDVAADPDIPVLLKRRDMVDINQLRTYFAELADRVAAMKERG